MIKAMVFNRRVSKSTGRRDHGHAYETTTNQSDDGAASWLRRISTASWPEKVSSPKRCQVDSSAGENYSRPLFSPGGRKRLPTPFQVRIGGCGALGRVQARATRPCGLTSERKERSRRGFRAAQSEESPQSRPKPGQGCDDCSASAGVNPHQFRKTPFQIRGDVKCKKKAPRVARGLVSGFAIQGL